MVPQAGREESMKAKTSPRFEELHQELIKTRERPGRAHSRDGQRDSHGGRFEDSAWKAITSQQRKG